jgi:hypothetical protein
MRRTFALLDEFRDIIPGKSELEITEITGRYLEAVRVGRDAPTRQPAARYLIDNLAARLVGKTRFCLELGRHVAVQGERRSNALMPRWSS